MELGLRGKTAIVTGGSLGIGRAIARELAQEGVSVAIIARDPRGFRLLPQRFRARPIRAVAPFPLI